jgi:hypothetical protein
MLDRDQIYESVRDIPIPENLTDVERGEYLACREAFAQLEAEWFQLGESENPDQNACLQFLKDANEKRKQQALDRFQLRKEVLEKHLEHETENIPDEGEDAKKNLFEQTIRGYYHSYMKICRELKNLMTQAGQDYESYIAVNGIEFPQVSADPHLKTRLQQPEEAGVRLSLQDCERDLQKIQELFDEMEQES